MRNERKYKILSLLSVLLGLLLLGNCFREPFRMNAATDTEHQEYVLAGAKIYAQNCIQCHGPHGEGVIGMPLNRKVNKVDPGSPAGKDVYNLLTTTIKQGRPGNSTNPERHQTPDGKWISYTAMPSWGRDYGGPLDDNNVKALVLFIMNEDGKQWDMPGTADAPTQPLDIKPDPKTGKIPLPDSANTDVNAGAQALLANPTGKASCLMCHTIGSKGGKIGPDLSHVGSWGVDQAFLEEWIKYPSPNPSDKEHPDAMPHDVRMPIYWSANRATVGPNLNLKSSVVSEGPYFMPRFKGILTDDQISTIARYLMGLK